MTAPDSSHAAPAPAPGPALARVQVVAPGALATLQDLGRPGWRRLGVPRAGALDPALLHLANRLAGNADNTAVIEFFATGPTLKALDHPLRLGLAGHFSATLQRANGERSPVDAWRSVTLQPGDVLQLGPLRASRVGCVAIGGLVVAPVLGSASTYARAGLGGQAGRALAAGDTLPAAALDNKSNASSGERWLRTPPARSALPIRVVPGPQDDYFSPETLAAFFSNSYCVSADADRMGVRLIGPALAHRPDKGNEIVSDATVPGSIQVPGNGLPIVLLADGQTVGGYPKIGTVVSADLDRLATAAVGATLRFAAVTVAQAEALAQSHHAALGKLLAAVEPLLLDGGIDLQALYTSNLVSGIIHAHPTDGADPWTST